MVGAANSYPASRSFAGSTRWPERSISSPISPKSVRIAKPGHGEDRRPRERRAERLGELLVRHRVGRGDVDGSAQVGAQCSPVGADDVLQPDPAEPLLAAADAASDTELERQEHPLERAAVVRQDDALTQMDDANARVTRGIGRSFPRSRDVGDEAGSELRFLGQDLVAAIAVGPDRGRADEYGRTGIEGRRRPGKETGRRRARLEDLALSRIRPALSDVLPAEIDDRIGAVEARRVELARGRIPANLTGAGRLAANEPQDVVPIGPKCRQECRADEPGSAAHDDSHDRSLASGSPRAAV